MNIKEAETLTGITKQNIRFYEKKGLLHPERGAENNYREYTEADVENLKLIKVLRRLDVSIEDIRRILDGEVEMDEVIQSHLRILLEKKSSLDAAIKMCRFLLDTDKETRNADEMLRKMDDMEKKGGLFLSIYNDYRKVSKAEHKREFTIHSDNMVLNSREFTEALLRYAAESNQDMVITKEGMYPVFQMHGIEYEAYCRNGRYEALIYCGAIHPELLEAEYGDVSNRKKKIFRFLYHGMLPLAFVLGVGLYCFYLGGSLWGLLLPAAVLLPEIFFRLGRFYRK